MKDTNRNTNNREPDQTGRPSYLGQFRDDWRSDLGIEPLLVAPVNCADWFKVYGGYIHRAFRTDEPTDKFNVPEPMRQYIEARLQKLTVLHEMDEVPRSMQADKQLSRLLNKPDKLGNSDNLEKPGDPRLALFSPSSRLSQAGWKRACRLASRLMALARRRPRLVRSVVLSYGYAATTRRYVVMTDAEDAEFGKLLIEAVHELHISELKIHLVGFRVGSNLPDIGHWLRLLELRPTTPVEFETANNVKSMARLKHVGIKLCWGAPSRASQEWHEVALLAALIELWRSVTPSHGFELAA